MPMKQREILEFVAFEQDDFEELEGSGEDLYRQEQARRCMEKGDFPEAITILEDLIEDRPAFWSAYNNLALAYFMLEKKSKQRLSCIQCYVKIRAIYMHYAI